MRDTARPVILVRELHVERLLVEHFERPVKFFGLTDGRPQVCVTRLQHGRCGDVPDVVKG